MPKRLEDPVAIIGGGVAGLALARVLAKEGVPFRLVERRPATAEAGLAFNLPGNAIQALSMLGLREHIESAGHPLGRRQYRTSGDRLLFEIDEDAFWGPSLRPRGVRRSALLSALSEGLPDASLLFDAEAGSIALQGTRPQVRLRDGRKLDAGLVVGADGVRSTVRREMFGAAAGRGHALLAPASWRFMAPDPGIACWTVWAGPEGMVLLMPVGDGEVYGWAALTAAGAGASGPERLYQMAGRFPSRVREAVLHALAHPDRLHRSPLEEVRLDLWHGERAVLIGDAAHATAPVWAEGVALGLEDALVLGGLLSGGQDVDAALVEFEARRRPRVAHVQAQTDAMSRAARLPPIVRNLLLPFVGPRRYRSAYGPLKVPV